jgi:hypothetical protein
LIDPLAKEEDREIRRYRFNPRHEASYHPIIRLMASSKQEWIQILHPVIIQVFYHAYDQT